MTTEADTLIEYGGEIKALDEDGDRLKIGGYAVLFGTPADGDLSPARDYFTKATDYGFDVATKGRVRWHHGLDPKIGRSVLGLVDFKTDLDEVGVWAEGWIRQREGYEKKVAEWVKARKAGFSTGVPAHCVGRKAVGDSHEITEWPLGADVSITLTPADPRQVGGVLSLKSLLDGSVDLSSKPFPDEAVAAPTLMERLSRSVADGEELVSLIERAIRSREVEGRDLSPDKQAAVKAYYERNGVIQDRLGLLVVAAKPKSDPAAREALVRSIGDAESLLATLNK